MLRRLGLGALVSTLVVAGSVAGTAVANTHRYDWNCSGAPRQACDSPAGAHSWSSSTAVNTANAYPKCSKLEAAGALISRICGYGYTIRAESNDRGLCPYPNPSGGPLGGCGYIYASVGNDTSVYHGLRGVGYY